MTIDEAIRYSKNRAKVHKENANNIEFPFPDTEIESAEKHKQLAEWLEELKRYRDSITAYQKGGNDAIECFVDEMKEFLFGCKASQGNLVRVDIVEMQIDKLANRLKAGEYDEYTSNEKV